jgi:hypothetical protein
LMLLSRSAQGIRSPNFSIGIWNHIAQLIASPFEHR